MPDRLWSRRPPLLLTLAALWFANFGNPAHLAAAPGGRTNIVLIVADDLGWGDLQCYGNTQFKTPEIDKMAEEGARLTNFTSCCPYCAPSRIGIQTGRYQFRSGLTDNPSPSRGHDNLGIPDSEVTLGQLFQSAGYRTMCIGKWHLGHQPQFFPLRHGYDDYLGILYSNDMVPVKMYRNNDVYRTLVFQPGLTKLYTDRALKFIDENKDRPFFLYLPHAMPHKPLAASTDFYRKSAAGLYGDVMAELDWSVGQILARIEKYQLEENTLVIFTSDNGPWYGGSTGGLRGMKGQTWEGGLRVPLIARWFGKIPRGQVSDEPAANVDLFTTCLKAANLDVPKDRTIDGLDIMPILSSDAKSPHEAIFSFKQTDLCTVRSGKWKLHAPASGPRKQKIMAKDEQWIDPAAPDGIRIFAPREQYHPHSYPGIVTGFDEPGWALFDMERDAPEQENVAFEHPEVVERLRGYYDKMLAEMPKSASKKDSAEKDETPASQAKNEE